MNESNLLVEKNLSNQRLGLTQLMAAICLHNKKVDHLSADCLQKIKQLPAHAFSKKNPILL